MSVKRGVGFQRQRDGVPDDEPDCQAIDITSCPQLIDLSLDNSSDTIAMLGDQFASYLKCFGVINDFHFVSVPACHRLHHDEPSELTRLHNGSSPGGGETRIDNLTPFMTSWAFGLSLRESSPLTP